MFQGNAVYTTRTAIHKHRTRTVPLDLERTLKRTLKIENIVVYFKNVESLPRRNRRLYVTRQIRVRV